MFHTEDLGFSQREVKVTPSDVVESIKKMFHEIGNPANISLLKGDFFKAELFEDGIKVENQGDEFFLPWSAFIETVRLLIGDPGSVPSEAVENNKPGDSGLYITSIDGVPTYVVYGGKLGYSVYKRIAPIAAVLIWAEICRYEAGYLILNK